MQRKDKKKKNMKEKASILDEERERRKTYRDPFQRDMSELASVSSFILEA